MLRMLSVVPEWQKQINLFCVNNFMKKCELISVSEKDYEIKLEKLKRQGDERKYERWKRLNRINLVFLMGIQFLQVSRILIERVAHIYLEKIKCQSFLVFTFTPAI